MKQQHSSDCSGYECRACGSHICDGNKCECPDGDWATPDGEPPWELERNYKAEAEAIWHQAMLGLPI